MAASRMTHQHTGPCTLLGCSKTDRAIAALPDLIEAARTVMNLYRTALGVESGAIAALRGILSRIDNDSGGEA